MIQTRRIGLGWLPGASIGVLSGFFIFNEPLREFHAVQEKKNKSKTKGGPDAEPPLPQAGHRERLPNGSSKRTEISKGEMVLD